MHSQTSIKEMLYSFPIQIEMGGFLSTTQKLAHAGWEFSAQQSMDAGGFFLRLAMRHKGMGLYAITAPLTDNNLAFEMIHGARSGGIRYLERLRDMVMHVSHVAPEIEFRNVPSYSLMRDQFKPVDVSSTFDVVCERISDFKFFKTANPQLQDIIVSPDQVPELMDMILRAQKPVNEEIKKRERTRENIKLYSNSGNVKPPHEVRCQLITLAI